MMSIRSDRGQNRPLFPSVHPEPGARPRTAPAVSLFGAPEAPDLLVQVSIELHWHCLGEIRRSGQGLALPPLPDGPALYRFRIVDAGAGSLHVGEAADIASRLAPLAMPAGAGRPTPLRTALHAELDRGRRVALDLVTGDRTVRVDGRLHPANLCDRPTRTLLARAARIAEQAQQLPTGRG